MATIDNTNWNYGKPIEGDSQATAPNGEKVQPVILDGSISEGSTGNGNIGYDASRIDTTDVNTKLQSIVFTEPDGSTTKPYEVENPEDLGSTNEVVVWIYDSNWATDDTVAFNFYSGGGDGTDYSAAGTGANPWGQTGIDEGTVQHFQDSPLTATDSVDGISGTINGAVSTNNGEFDGAASFDGTDDYIDSNKSIDDVVNSGQPITISFWMKSSSSDGIQGIVSNFGTASSSEGQIYVGTTEIQTNGDIILYYDSNTDTGGNYINTTNSYTDGNWHYVVATKTADGGPETLEIYIDGEEASTVSNGSSVNTNLKAASTNVEFGRRNSGAEFNGEVDEIHISNSVPSSSEIQAEFDASPKGGQIFFNAQSGSATDQVGSVVQTNSSGVIQTTADGVVKTEP